MLLSPATGTRPAGFRSTISLAPRSHAMRRLRRNPVNMYGSVAGIMIL